MMRFLVPAVSSAILLLALAAHGDLPERETDASATKPDPRFAVADTPREEGRFDEALPIYRALRDEFAAAGDTAQQWYADMLRRAGDGEASDAALAEALSLAGNDPQRVAATRLGKCNFLSWLGQSDAAIAECTDGLEMARSASDRQLEARAHFLLGTIHSRRGRYRQSVAETEKALELRRRYGSSPYEMAGTLNSMGIEYAAVGRLGEAENMYRDGLALANSFATPWYAYFLHSNLAHLRAATGDMEGALDSMNESLRGAEDLDDKQGMVYAHNSFAEFYLGVGNRTAARSHLDKSLAINEEVSQIYRVISLGMLGEIEAAEGPQRTGGEHAHRGAGARRVVRLRPAGRQHTRGAHQPRRRSRRPGGRATLGRGGRVACGNAGQSRCADQGARSTRRGNGSRRRRRGAGGLSRGN